MNNRSQSSAVDKTLIIATIIGALFVGVLGYFKFGNVSGVKNNPILSVCFYCACALLALFIYGIIYGMIKNKGAKEALLKGTKRHAKFVKAQVFSRTSTNTGGLAHEYKTQVHDKYSITLRFTNSDGIQVDKKIAGLFTLSMVQYLQSQDNIDVYVYKNNCALDDKYFNMNLDHLQIPDSSLKHNDNVIEYNGDNAEDEKGKIENKFDEIDKKAFQVAEKIHNSDIVSIGRRGYTIFSIIITILILGGLYVFLGIQAVKLQSFTLLIPVIPFTVILVIALIITLKKRANRLSPPASSKGAKLTGRNVQKSVEHIGKEEKYFISFSYYNDVNGSKTIRQEVPKMIFEQVEDGGTIPIRIHKGNANIDIAYFYDKFNQV